MYGLRYSDSYNCQLHVNNHHITTLQKLIRTHAALSSTLTVLIYLVCFYHLLMKLCRNLEKTTANSRDLFEGIKDVG